MADLPEYYAEAMRTNRKALMSWLYSVEIYKLQSEEAYPPGVFRSGRMYELVSTSGTWARNDTQAAARTKEILESYKEELLRQPIRVE